MELKSAKNKNIINNITKGSIAEEVGIKPRDLILSINSVPIEDTIEYSFLESDEYVELEIQHQDGTVVIYEIEKDYDEELGLEFSNPIIDSVKTCNNKCLFCFIDQLPEGMRETLYIKDDDSRLSFLQGNFITMTNMKDKDIDKMVRYRISPVNISVHTTNEALRVKMLSNKFASNINENMKKLANAGIQMNGQIVCIPEINDKTELENTIKDLAELHPNMNSVAVVPVGLTKFRDNLADIKCFDKKSSAQLIDEIEKMQSNYLSRLGTRFVFASDEFYVLAERELPPYEVYEDFTQLENGVGLIRKFENELMDSIETLADDQKAEGIKITIATGASAYEFMKKMAALVMDTLNISIEVEKINNDFFGHSITVAGLITGQDIVSQLKNKDLGDALFLPRVMFRSDELVLLDDMKLDELEQKIGYPVVVVEINGKDFIDKILDIRR